MTTLSRMKDLLLNREWWRRFLSTLRYSLYVIRHPFDGFWDLTHENRGSVAAANFIVLCMLLLRLASLQYTSFMFNFVYWPTVNIVEQCMSILLPLAMWVLCNWGLTTLFDGKGTLKDVYMATAYALTPYVLLSLPMIILSNYITVDEGAFYIILNALSLIWPAFLIICAMMMIHDYSLSKTLLFTLMTVIGMLIVLFLLLVLLTLIGDGAGYIVSMYREIVYRLN